MDNWIKLDMIIAKKTIRWKPYTTKDVRDYLYAIGDHRSDKKIIEQTLKTMRSNIHQDDVTIYDDLSTTDKTYLFAHMKARSYSNLLDGTTHCQKEGCLEYPFTIDILKDIKANVDNYEHFKLSSGDVIIFKEPVFEKMI